MIDESKILRRPLIACSKVWGCEGVRTSDSSVRATVESLLVVAYVEITFAKPIQYLPVAMRLNGFNECVNALISNHRFLAAFITNHRFLAAFICLFFSRFIDLPV